MATQEVDKASMVVWEKPHRRMTDEEWEEHCRSYKAMLAKKIQDSYDLRHSSQQRRNELRIQTAYGKYHNDSKLDCRTFEIYTWKHLLGEVLDLAVREAKELRDEKASIERLIEMSYVAQPTNVESMSTLDSRPLSELTSGRSDAALKNEFCVVETNRNLLVQKCEEVWKSLNILDRIKFELTQDMNDKRETLEIDNEQLNLTSDSEGISLKVDATSAERTISYEQWLMNCRDSYEGAKIELSNAVRVKRELLMARNRYKNSLTQAMDTAEYELRHRMYLTQRCRNELGYLKVQMENDMRKLWQEILNLQNSFEDKEKHLQLAQTRLVNRSYRPGKELARDMVYEGLLQEEADLQKSLKELELKLSCAKTQYTLMEKDMSTLNQELANKTQFIELDYKVLLSRRSMDPSRPDRPQLLTLRNISDEIAQPFHC